MRILVVSDIHSNPWSLEAILREEPGFDLFCCAGDIVDYGIAPAETIAALRRIAPRVVVSGNHDRLLIETYRSGGYRSLPPGGLKWVHQNCQLIENADVEYLENLPACDSFVADGWAYLVAHQYRDNYETIESISEFDGFWRMNASAPFKDARRRRMIFGHSHRRGIHTLGEGAEWINPGSTSYRRPDDPDKSAHYITIDNGDVSLKSVRYDHSSQLAEAYSRLGKGEMMETELQDFFFFFGPAKTPRDPLPESAQP